jgi:hypothetical protein
MKPGLAIERLPITYKQPFDCINDNANCPACKRRRNNHGVAGSAAVYAVRAEHEGKLYAVTLQVFGGDYLPITRQWWHDQGLRPEPSEHKPADLTIHREHLHGIVACAILGDGRLCRPETGFLAAEALFDAHGNRDATIDLREQPETLWIALESCLVDAIFGTAGGVS